MWAVAGGRLYIYTLMFSYSLLPAATKLGQGNIFRSMCQEFCPQGGVGLVLGGCLKFSGGRGVWSFQRGVSEIFRGGVWNFGGAPNFFFFFFQFLFPPKKSFWDAHPPTRWSMRGRYASYWNAFLLNNKNSVKYHWPYTAKADF